MTRLFSAALAALLLLCSLPTLLIAGLLIKASCPGPLFFRQLREGRHGAKFHIWKLRTMVPNADPVLQRELEVNSALADEWRRFGCLRRDPRIAGKVAKLARQLSLDELPQLWNICRGEMAFVGPRPLEIFLAESLLDGARRLRNSVLPGVTGLWQIGPRSDISVRQMQFYDRLYVTKKGLALDCYILWKTFGAVWRKTGI